MKRLLPLLLLLILVTACDDRKEEAQEEQISKQEERSTAHTIDLSAHDVPLVVELDQTICATDTPEVHWNEEFGKLEVNAGERFRITISEEKGDLNRLKADLQRDMLRKNTIIEETPELVIYRSEFPDEDLVFIHFYRVVTHEGRSFVIESNDQGRFNESDIRQMAGSVRPAQQA